MFTFTKNNLSGWPGLMSVWLPLRWWGPSCGSAPLHHLHRPARGHSAAAWVIPLKTEGWEPPRFPVTQGPACPPESHSAGHRSNSLSGLFPTDAERHSPRSGHTARFPSTSLCTVWMSREISRVSLSRRRPDGGRVCGEPQLSPRSPQSDPALLSVLSHGHHREQWLDPGAGSWGSALAQVLPLQESPDLSPDLSKCDFTGPFFSYRHVSCPQGAYRLLFPQLFIAWGQELGLTLCSLQGHQPLNISWTDLVFESQRSSQ